jgi:hypothetical protein
VRSLRHDPDAAEELMTSYRPTALIFPHGVANGLSGLSPPSGVAYRWSRRSPIESSVLGMHRERLVSGPRS